MIAKFLTGEWSIPGDLFAMLARAAAAHRVLLTVLAVAAVLAVVAGARSVRRWRAREATRAVWLRIQTPAATVTGDAGVFARRITNVLHRTRRIGVRARHLVLEVHASADRTQIGVWVPPGIDHDEITAAITGAWPGATVTRTTPPIIAEHRAVVAKEVTARHGPWAPWIDSHPTRAPIGSTRQTTAVDPLDGVLERLTARAVGETGVVQLVLATYHRRTLARLLMRGAAAALSELLALLRFALSDTRRTTTGARPAASSVPPLATAAQKAMQAKQAAGPHLSATLRVGVTSTQPIPHGRAAAAQIAGGFDAVATASDSGGLVTHRTRYRRYRTEVRRPGRRFIATPAEVAALWHLPADPARYGLPTVRARTRSARPALRLPGHKSRPDRTASRRLPQRDPHRRTSKGGPS
ncbi:hypothetical protein [Nocardia sp. BMG51109]|uniref:hypothetical protein n=1 Tax=Nocardia sp. BMG51109 TaxID=1056816 RepID=UPI000466265F|nr:hypothetical protein [Nocardia sp. BMG51109]